jgi:hypothetical protein
MVRRYDLTRSDNAPFTGRKAYATYGRAEGYIFINSGFMVRHAIISWSSIYIGLMEEPTSSSTELSETSSESSSSTELSETSGESSSSTEAKYSSSCSSSSEEWYGQFDYPRIYVCSYQYNGFTVRYENIPANAKYIEFEYLAL